MRGSQPTGLILGHRAGQIHIKDLPDILIPPLTEVIKLYEMTASAGGSFGEVKAHAQIYQYRSSREAQNAEMLIQCLKASIKQV